MMPLRITIAWVLAILTLALSPFPRAFDSGQERRYEISRHDAQFSKLRPLLPAHGTVGYLGNLPPDKILSDSNVAAMYYVAQYALAPVVLVHGAKAEFVVGFFRERAGYEEALKTPGVRQIGDFGNGVFLFQKDAP